MFPFLGAILILQSGYGAMIDKESGSRCPLPVAHGVELDKSENYMTAVDVDDAVFRRCQAARQKLADAAFEARMKSRRMEARRQQPRRAKRGG